MLSNMNDKSIQGSIFRVKCDYRCFDSSIPYDGRCDETKLGTAFLLQLNGIPIIVTAHHVIDNAIKITVTSPTIGDGEARTLRIIGYNPHLDVAILMGDSDLMSLPPFIPKTSSTLGPQDEVIAIGFAAGTLRTHTTSGTISGRNEFPHNRIQTDTAVNGGNSGGPVVDVTTKRVVGIVTSGMDDMQTTNFFTPMDEAWQSIRRMILLYNQNGTIGVDMGYRLNAVVRCINSAACHGKAGGAYVAAALPDIGLEKGDVILQVNTPEGKMVSLNAQMRVQVPSIWLHDAFDFRSIFDALTETDVTTTVDMVVRRNNQKQLVKVQLGRAQMASRELFPDCEPVSYVTFGGLVFQTASKSHMWRVEGISKKSFDKPSMELDSKVIITHVSSGSPFASHGSTKLEGCVVERVENEHSEQGKDIHTLKDLDEAMRELNPVLLVLSTGFRIGAFPKEIVAYDSQQTDNSLRRGIHTVLLGPTSSKTFNSAVVNVSRNAPLVSENERIPSPSNAKLVETELSKPLEKISDPSKENESKP